MSDSPDYILELSSLAQNQQESAVPAGESVQEQSAAGPRKWIGVHFRCCDVYTRIWRNREGTAYVGYCPKCHRKVQARVGPNGISGRFFEAE